MTKNDLLKKETIKDIPLFSELNIKQLRLLISISRLEKKGKQEILFMEGEIYKGFYLVLKGSVKVYKSSKDGKEYILHIFTPPQPFADVPLFEGSNYPANAQTIEESILLFIPKEPFIELIKNDPSISLKMLAGFAKRLRVMTSQIEDLSMREVTNRLAKYIVRELGLNGTINSSEPFLKLSVSKSTIASLIGTITETLSRTFKKLQSEKIIRVKGNKIFIDNMRRLKELAQ